MPPRRCRGMEADALAGWLMLLSGESSRPAAIRAAAEPTRASETRVAKEPDILVVVLLHRSDRIDQKITGRPKRTAAETGDC